MKKIFFGSVLFFIKFEIKDFRIVVFPTLLNPVRTTTSFLVNCFSKLSKYFFLLMKSNL